MKKILSLMLILCTLTACAPVQTAPETTQAETTQTETTAAAVQQAAPIDSIPLDTILYLFQDMTDVGLNGFYQKPITPETTSYEIGYQDFSADFESAMALTPVMNTTPFVLAVFRLSEDSDPAAFAADLEKNANPRKWVCVSAEKVYTRVSGRTVLFAMSSEDLVEPITDCFAQMTQAGFNPDTHILNPLADKTPQDLYDELYSLFAQEEYGFMDGKDLTSKTQEAPYGLSKLDFSQVQDFLLDDGFLPQDAEDTDRAYLFAIFHLIDGASAESFADTLRINLDSTALQGGEASHLVSYGRGYVLVYAGTGSFSISATALESYLPITYRLTAIPF